MPALLTRMSIRPSSLAVRATMPATAALSVTSAATAIALTPCRFSSATAAADFVSLRPTMAMSAPASASPRAMPSPIPPLPPVTIATLPRRSKSAVVIAGVPLAMPGPGPFMPGASVRRRGWPGQDGRATCRVWPLRSTLALADQDQAERGQRRAVTGPLDLPDHEAGLRPVDHTGALANPEQAYSEREQADNQKQFAHCSSGQFGNRASLARGSIQRKDAWPLKLFPRGTKKPR